MELRANFSTCAGLYFTALSTLSFELVLTRIFSVTAGYHFAFLVVSLAMFGMTAGALLVYLFPAFFSDELIHRRLSQFALLMGLAAPVVYLSHTALPVSMEVAAILSASGFFRVFLDCILLSVPFILGGVCVCLLLTRFGRDVSKLYAADLLGAASACFFVAITLELTDGPTSYLLSAALAALAGIFYAIPVNGQKWMNCAVAGFILLASLASVNAALLRCGQESPFRIVWIDGVLAPEPLYERWNSFSMVRVLGDPEHPFRVSGWGLSPGSVTGVEGGQLSEDIDTRASTPITRFRGNLQEVDYLRRDVTNVAHYIVHNARVLVIGVGGGRDVLSALVFKQHEILGVELNKQILDVLTRVFGDFSGHLDRLPAVHFVNDEARSYISRSRQKFDLIQISLVDTWAATASGAFALAENTLYTREAWQTLIEHLSPGGVLSVSRWYSDRDPAEIYRLVSLASVSLKLSGVQNPRDNLMLLKYDQPASVKMPGVGTLLVSRSALSQEQIRTLEMVAGLLGFRVMLSPNQCADSHLSLLASQTENPDSLCGKFRTAIAPPTDDCPYFFQMARLPEFNKWASWWNGLWMQPVHTQGLGILIALSLVLSFLLAFTIFLPLRLRKPAFESAKYWPCGIYFMSIGAGFMFVEISQMQRWSIFLGHPSYGLSVVLFSMLAFTGLGSLMSSFMDDRKLFLKPGLRLFLVCAVIILDGVAGSWVWQGCATAATVPRVVLAVLCLAPLGLAAGVAFPTGMNAVERAQGSSITPWLWAINGAASVLASVLAALLAITCGISVCYCLSVFWYALAGVAISLLPVLAFSKPEG